MKIKLDQAKQLSNNVLTKIGFSIEDSNLITKNLIDAELSGKKSHGLLRIPSIVEIVDSGKLSISSDDIEIIKDNPSYLLINAKYKPAFIPIYKSLEIAINKAKKTGVCVVGIQNSEYCSGFIGSYARQAALSDLIYIGFNNSPGVLVPHGAKNKMWGTNPITVGVPSADLPVVLDMSSSIISWGNLMVAKQENKSIISGVAIDKNGDPTIDPAEAMQGGLLPFAGHKGSGLAFIIELIAGALTGSRVGFAVKGGWGSTYILINPEIFRPLDDFKNDVREAIEELKQSPKAQGVEKIYFPGEKSQLLRKTQSEKGEIDINDLLYAKLTDIVNNCSS